MRGMPSNYLLTVKQFALRESMEQFINLPMLLFRQGDTKVV